MTLKEYCIGNQREELLAQWDLELNRSISPDGISSYSHRLLWWRCAKGHAWQAKINDRTRGGSGCPYCSGKVAWRGETDLATLYPDIAVEWHPTKNGNVIPEDVTAGTDKNYWWQCSLGHEWKATVENRALKGTKCPYCTGRRAWPGFNDLATEYPQLMKEWYYEYNRGVDPTRLRSHSAKRVYWRCAEGHVWDTCIFNRTSKRQSGCPVCAGNIKKGVGFARVDIDEMRRQREQENERVQTSRKAGPSEGKGALAV